ncbi:glycosyltransferase family 4 protein [Flagellimonas iocasae]|uniref:Glycosyltransferase family 4 protein n=1 Tax=Flagellimonas iocasae TaxID=2055905 RepID=A0ABW4XY49_9FLAO
MKIDFVISGLNPGGAERVMVILANHFSDIGHDVSLISLNEGDAYTISSNINRIKLHHGRIKAARIRGLFNLIGHYKDKKNRPDVMISFITLMNLLSIFVAKLYRIPIIVSEHNSYLRYQKPKWLCDFTRTFFYPKANYVTVLTLFDLPYYNKKGCKTVVMPNPATFTPIAQLPATRKKYILAVGSLDRYLNKGFDNLIRLIEPILKANKDWDLKIIGGGDKGKPILTDLVAKNNLSERIHFTGQVNNVRDLMAESEIFILPSRFEGLPMVLLEAMSQGMACIAYDCKTGPSEMITQDVNGLLIDDQNEEEMQKGLTRLMESEHLRRQLGENALKSLEKYSIENVANIWEGLFQEIKTRS